MKSDKLGLQFQAVFWFISCCLILAHKWCQHGQAFKCKFIILNAFLCWRHLVWAWNPQKIYHDSGYFPKRKPLIKIEDAEHKLNNSITQQIHNIDHLPGSANQNKFGRNDHCLPDDRGIRPFVRQMRKCATWKVKLSWSWKKGKIRSIKRSTCSSDRDVSWLCQETGNSH